MKDKKTLYGLIVFFGLLLVSFAFALLLLAKDSSKSGSGDGPEIGVVDVSGVITSSKHPVRALRRFAKDKDVKAVVVRLNTPGGAVGPSQEIYREIERVRKKKPVVASMGSVAASGGYYVAAACEKIVANPGTITGSIGVIIQTTEVAELLSLAKIKAHTLKSGELKDAGSLTRAMTEKDRAFLQSVVDSIYQQFVADVAKGRKLDKSKFLEVADGRVLTGAQAKKVGLVDQLGNFSDALEVAAKLAKAKGDPVPVRYRPRQGLLQQLIDSSVKSAADSVKAELQRSVRIEARHPGL